MRSTNVLVFVVISFFSAIIYAECKVSENFFSVHHAIMFGLDDKFVAKECKENGLVGELVFWGYDCDDSGAIENWEIESSCYNCYPPKNFVVVDGKIGNSCIQEGIDLGGLRYTAGADINNNGVLDEEEIMRALIICNGGEWNKQLAKDEKEFEEPTQEEIRDSIKESNASVFRILKEERENQKPSQPTKPKESREPLFMALVVVPAPEKSKKKNREEKRKEK